MKPRMDAITTLLWCTDSELEAFRKKATKAEEKITDQDLSAVVSSLGLREHALELRLHKELTENKQYRMPENWIRDIEQHIAFFQSDTQVRAKIEALGNPQAVFYGLLSRIQQVIMKPDEISARPPHLKLDVSKTEPGEDHDSRR